MKRRCTWMSDGCKEVIKFQGPRSLAEASLEALQKRRQTRCPFAVVTVGINVLLSSPLPHFPISLALETANCCKVCNLDLICARSPRVTAGLYAWRVGSVMLLMLPSFFSPFSYPLSSLLRFCMYVCMFQPLIHFQLPFEANSIRFNGIESKENFISHVNIQRIVRARIIKI